MTLFRGKSLKLYLDGTKTNQILFLLVKTKKEWQKTWTQKPEKIHEKTKKRLAYIITRRGLLIIFGSWHTLFMSGVLMAGEHYMLLSNTQIGYYPHYLYILFIYINIWYENVSPGSTYDGVSCLIEVFDTATVHQENEALTQVASVWGLLQSSSSNKMLVDMTLYLFLYIVYLIICVVIIFMFFVLMCMYIYVYIYIL